MKNTLKPLFEKTSRIIKPNCFQFSHKTEFSHKIQLLSTEALKYANLCRQELTRISM